MGTTRTTRAGQAASPADPPGLAGASSIVDGNLHLFRYGPRTPSTTADMVTRRMLASTPSRCAVSRERRKVTLTVAGLADSLAGFLDDFRAMLRVLRAD